MAKTMVAGFKRLPQRAYPGGYTSCFGSRTHFQLATFYALTETPEVGSSSDGNSETEVERRQVKAKEVRLQHVD